MFSGHFAILRVVPGHLGVAEELFQFEVTVEAVRHRVAATVVKTPFFNPPRKTATPPA